MWISISAPTRAMARDEQPFQGEKPLCNCVTFREGASVHTSCQRRLASLSATWRALPNDPSFRWDDEKSDK